MSHNVEAKALQKLLQERELEHKDCLLVLVNQLNVLRSSVSEASVFVEQRNNSEAAHALTTAYYDCQKLCDYINSIINAGVVDASGVS